ncbi:hypothetical protein GAO09_19305 [Rhizobiales bacterium RZME27]|uniref:Uncharacterized protein n=1 Tax=Endobacterium cereale TaxID=2663029 RepID=A0A6A8AG38_9HYPH|nr:hypothetical protein [Endobacterium cereale]MQY48186.1 hypothetical protein [Endobacterium cereale]
MADDFKNSACYAAAANAAKAAGQELDDRDLAAAYRAAQAERDSIKASGAGDNVDAKVREAAERLAERTRIAAALQKRHAALNIIARDRLDQTIGAFKAAGLSPRNAILAVMEGSQQGVAGARNSVAAKTLAYEARYVGGMLSEIQKNRPHLVNVLSDKRLSDDTFREMGELREGGNPGVTGNDDARYLAGVFANYAEMSRTELNRLGASIGKLDGWAGAQVHDDLKMMAAGKDSWVEAIAPWLDLKRTFPDAGSANEVRDILRDVYDTLITGIPNKATAKEKGQRVNPANLAKSLGKTRVLHFKDAEAALAYRDAFGYGNSIYGVMAHQRRAAQMAGQMETFGPNPEIMFNSIVDTERRKIRDSATLSDKEKIKQLDALNGEAGALRGAFDVMSGAVSRPGNVNAAKIAGDIRAVQSMAKLGGAVLTAMPTDVVGAAQASMFRGDGFFNGMVKQISGIFKGRPKGEQAEISFLFGEGFDSLIGEVMSRGMASDGAVGKLSRMQEAFFKWNGLNWWTDVGRSVVGRTVAAEMGMRAAVAHAELPANYRHVLGLHGIGEEQWKAIQQVDRREIGGKRYITPDAVRDISDEAIAPLVADRLAGAKTEARKAEILADGKRDLELSLLRFVADETNYAIVETDAASRRISTLGTRPGTFAGESVRFVMQFKGFPIAFSQRILGRSLFGGRGATKWERVMNNTPHLGALMAGLTVAGYMAMTMKDAAKGYWPPRDPLDPKVMTAALTQGGALGIYGDFLFGEANRFGSGALETFSGPFIGTVSDIINVPLKARTAIEKGESPKMAGDLLNLALNNTPFINLAYTRPALDVLFLNSMKDWASPGYINRQRKTRLKDYGQTSPLPATLSEALR